MNKELRYGFTTGSCATVAAKAAAYMIFTKSKIESMKIMTPEGIEYPAQIHDIDLGDNWASCSVVKDSGDDPDVTNGIRIYAKVSLGKDCIKSEKYESLCESELQDVEDLVIVKIDGGKGVGRVTKPGLDQKVGEAAINHVPRQMISSAVREVAYEFDYAGEINVLISVPEGEALADKTMNPRLGIQGGISILGSSGIVRPMSTKAILDTIRVEINQHKALGQDILAVSPGNYGLDFMKKQYGYDLEKSVKCSNYIGNTIDMAVEAGFTRMLLTGHIGKLIKLAGGIMNTHSKEGDCRMELLTAAGLRCGLSANRALEILSAVTTEEGIRILNEEKLTEKTMKNIMESICFYLNKRTAGKIEVEVIIYSNVYGELAKSKGAEDMLLSLLKSY